MSQASTDRVPVQPAGGPVLAGALAPQVVVAPPPRSLDEVPGWLKPTDLFLFDWLLDRQSRRGQRGDLVELGAYHGKSAIRLGYHLRPGERLVVCDLFDLVHDADFVGAAARESYRDLTQAAFERNYLAFHQKLPVIVRGPSGGILAHVAPASSRFVHVDASHLYEHVRTDLRSARCMMQLDGIVAFDDYRAAHTPGTAAAVWEAMANDGLRVVCVSDHKFYGTWGDAVSVREELTADLTASGAYRVDVETVMGQRLARVVPLRAATRRSAAPRPRTRPAPATAAGPRWQRVAVALLPPVVTDSLRRHRRGRNPVAAPDQPPGT